MSFANKRITVREMKALLAGVPDDAELSINVINSNGKRRQARIAKFSVLTANRPHMVEVDVAP